MQPVTIFEKNSEIFEKNFESPEFLKRIPLTHKLTPTTKRTGACGVCGDESGKCRTNGDIYLCMTFADLAKGQTQNGYKCLKPNRGKGWATFRIDDSQNWTDDQRRDWRDQATRRRNQQAAELLTKRKNLLSAQERDRQYRAILAELHLHPGDRTDLLRRGFTSQEIEWVGFKSAEKYQKLRGQYPELLPGVGIGGSSLVNFDSGYLCPIRDKSGLIVACQIRLRALREGEKNRYRWLTSNKRGQVPQFFPEGGNPEGELPLTVCRPIGEPKGIALAEGTGAKPNLVALRHGLLTIGAAGGQWASSPATFKATLEQLASEAGTRQVTIFPDAGDVQNEQVLGRWQATISLLQEWGYQVQVAWWGQFQKSDPDIDELTGFGQIHYLAPSEFFKLVEPEPEQKPGKSDRAWELWRSSRRFTATETINQQYFDYSVPDPGVLLAVRSGLGTGKTEWIKRLVQALDGEGWIALGYRNSLLIQSAVRWGFYHLHQDDAKGLLADPNLKVACCVDSLVHFEPHYFDGKNLILDEACSVLAHLLFAKTSVSRYRKLCKERFVEALKRAKRILVLDGLLSDKDVDYLVNLIGDSRKVIKVKNEYQGNGKNVFFLRETLIKNKSKLNDRSPLIQLIQEVQRCAIATDSQIEAEGIDQVLTRAGKKVVRLDSKTSSQGWVAEFLKSPVEWLNLNKPDVLIFTPSAESGVDIPIQGYFDAFYCLFFGAVLTNAQQQMLGRIRDTNCPVFVYCQTTGIPSDKVSRATLPEDLTKIMLDFVLADGFASLAGVDQEQAVKELFKEVLELSKNSHFHHECKLLALQNHEEKNLRDCLSEALIEAGHNVQEVKLEGANIDDLLTAKEEIKDGNAQDIFNAETIPIEQIDQINSQQGLDWDTRCQIQKAKLLDRLPGIEQTEQWSPQFVRRVLYDERGLVGECELFWLLHNPEVAKSLQQSRWFGILKSGQTNLAGHRSRFLKVKTLREIGLLQFLQEGFTWSAGSEAVKRLYDRYRNSKRHQENLGLFVGKLSPVDLVGRLLKKVGVPTRSEWHQTKNGRIRVYQVDLETLQDADRLSVLQAVETRFRSTQEGREKPDWVSLFEPVETARNQLQQILEPDHLQPDLYTNQEQGDQIIPETLEEAKSVAEMLENCPDPDTVEVVRNLPGITSKLWALAAGFLSERKRQQFQGWGLNLAS